MNDVINLHGVKKVFTIGVVAATILWSIGIAAVVPLQADAAAPAAGSLVKASLAAVYYVGADGQRYVFPNEKTYKTWYADFSSVIKITDAELAALTIGGNVTNKPGVRMVKITTDPKVYAVEANGSLRWVETAEVAAALYGSNWNKAIDDVADSFFTNYKVGASIAAANQYSLYSSTKNSLGYFIDPVKLPASISADKGLGASTPSTPSTPTVGTGLSVELAADSPVATTLITTQNNAKVAKLTFKSTGGKMKVTGLTLKRSGVTADTSLTNVYLFEGNSRLTDAASVSSNSEINFTNSTGLFEVDGTKTISVLVTFNGTAGENVQLGIESADKVTVSSGTVTGSFPVRGAVHTLASATLASVAFAAATSSGATDPGSDVNLLQSTVTIGTRDVHLHRIAFRQIGSINSPDIKNFRLLMDGVEIGKVDALDASSYITFVLDNKLMQTGGRVLKVIADVIGGSGRNVQLSLRGTYDVDVTDSQYGAGITPTGTFPVGASSFSINAGTVTVVKKTDSAADPVTRGASDVSLAKYTLTAYGEEMKVETLRVGMITTGGTVTDHSIRNVRLLVNNSQVGSTTTVPAAATFAAASGTSFTTNFTIVPGTPATAEIRGDIFDNEGTNEISAGTVTAVQALLVGGAGTGNTIPKISLGTTNVPSQANVLGNNLTISAGSITHAQQTNYTGQTTVVPQTAYKIAAFNLLGNSTEAANINTFEIDFIQVSGTTFDASDDLTDLYIKYGSTLQYQTAVKGSVTDSDNTWSVSYTLAKNETLPIEVYATIGSTITAADSIRVDFTTTGVTALSSVTVYADVDATDAAKNAGFNGQTIAAGTGSITVAVDASAPVAALLDDTGLNATAAFKFTTANDSYTVTDIVFTIGDASAVQYVNLYDGNTLLTGGQKPGATTVTYAGLTWAIPANTTKVLTVKLQLGAVGTGAGTSGASLLTTLTSATARNSQGTSAAVTESPSNPAGNAMYVYKAIPTITNVALPTTVLNTGTQTLSKFTISSGGTGAIEWAKILFTVAKNVGGTDTITSPTLWNSDSNTQVTGTPIVTTLGDNNTSGSITFVPNTPQPVSGSVTYDLRATVNGTIGTGESIQTNIAQPSSFAASVAAFAVTNSASGSLRVYDADTSATLSAGDIRLTASPQFTTADVSAAADTTGHNAATAGITQAYGITGSITATLAEHTTDNVIAAGTFTMSGAGATGVTCTPFTGTDGTGAVTSQVTTFGAIQSVTCAGTNMQLLLRSMTVSNDSGVNTGNAGLVIVMTKGTDYAVGSTAAALNSDLALPLTGGVAPAASIVTSDVSAQSHGISTTDWTNGYLIKTLPNTTQTLSR